jgi:hypothetical protein
MRLRISATLLLAPLPLAAQSTSPSHDWQWSISGTAGQEIIQSRVAELRERLRGTILGLEGILASERLMLRVRYGEGRVSPRPDESDVMAARELVEGEALVGYRATPWLTFWAGPNARAYTAETAGGDQRWLFWAARATARGTILPGRAVSFVELWKSVSGGLRDGSASGQGAEGGLDLLLSGAAWWGRIAYRIEQGTGDGALREMVETLALSISYAPR